MLLQSYADLTTIIESMMSGVVGSLWGLLVLGLIVAAFGVVNTLGMNVLEQTRELGLLRVVAMTRGQVRKAIVAQAAMLGLLGVAHRSAGGHGDGLRHEPVDAACNRSSCGFQAASAAAARRISGGHDDRAGRRLDPG